MAAAFIICYKIYFTIAVFQSTHLETFDLIDGESGGVSDLLKVDVRVGVGLGHLDVLVLLGRP